jgi:hypothetical protein
MSLARAYEEVVDFIAGGTTPSTVASYRPSSEVRERVSELIYREKADGLSPEETSELDHYMQIEHLMRLAKARAKKLLAV